MINISTDSRNKPFLLKPAQKDYLWGGSRLHDKYGKEMPQEPLAETWECSTHPEGQSVVANGPYKGSTLREVLELHPEYLGTHPKNQGDLPIMIKFIDAKKDLSIQVHPDDDYANEHENGQRGKTEMWYVAEAPEGTQLIYGFQHDITRNQLEESLKHGTVERYLQRINIHKNDVFFIPAGMVHAIGAGALIVEVQETSNLTYRLYDYKRTDKNKKARALHIQKALAVASRKGSAKPRQPMRVLKYQKGAASEILCRCQYFQVERYLLNTETSRCLVDLHAETNSFKVFLCLDGCGVIYMESQGALNFFKGDCIFVPADSVTLKFHGKAQFLCVTC